MRYCDRNVCFRNIYNEIECDECEVTRCQNLHARAVESARARLENAETNLKFSKGNEKSKRRKQRTVEVAEYILEVLLEAGK